MMTRVVGDELVEGFARDGFVVVPDLLPAGELDPFALAVDEGVARRKQHDTRDLTEKSRYEQSFIQCINLWEDCPGVRPLTFHPRVAEAAATLLRCDRVRLWHDQALYKEPGGRVTDPHQDHPYWPVAETDAVTAWIPLDGSTLEGGAMGYLPGSHRLGIRRFVNIFVGDPEPILDEEQLRAIEPVFVEVPKGSIAFHRSLTFHLANPNRMAKVRRVHTAIYFRDGCTRGSEARHPSVDRAEIGVGDVIASDVTPIAWPRPGGDLPPTPAIGTRSHGGTWPAGEER